MCICMRMCAGGEGASLASQSLLLLLLLLKLQLQLKLKLKLKLQRCMKHIRELSRPPSLLQIPTILLPPVLYNIALSISRQYTRRRSGTQACTRIALGDEERQQTQSRGAARVRHLRVRQKERKTATSSAQLRQARRPRCSLKSPPRRRQSWSLSSIR